MKTFHINDVIKFFVKDIEFNGKITYIDSNNVLWGTWENFGVNPETINCELTIDK